MSYVNVGIDNCSGLYSIYPLLYLMFYCIYKVNMSVLYTLTLFGGVDALWPTVAAVCVDDVGLWYRQDLRDAVTSVGSGCVVQWVKAGRPDLVLYHMLAGIHIS